jgi:glycopeptide antibiotics resistance protein
VLFCVYAVLLIAVVLFKFPFQYQLTGDGSELNLIPFAGSFANPRLGVGEVIENVVIFLPLGLYVSLLKRRWPALMRILTIVATSVAFEAIQFVFAIGRADITDVLGNTLGGAIGMGVYAISRRIFGPKTNQVLNIVGVVVTVLVVVFFTFLRLHSR